MTRLRTIDLSDVLGELPSPSPLDTVGDAPDLLVCALGFEPRTSSVALHLAERQTRIGAVRYLTYAGNTTDNEANEPELLAALQRLTDDVASIAAESEDLARQLTDVTDRGQGSVTRVIVDITSMSNQLTLRVLMPLLSADIDVTIVYAEAREYFPTADEHAAALAQGELAVLAEGVGRIIYGVEQPGHHFEALPELVLVFPGFTPDRTRAVLSEVDHSLLTEPGDRVVWFFGRPRLPEDQWRLDAVRDLHPLSASAPQHSVSTFDYRETIRELERAHGGVDGLRRITLAPMGSKLQSLGCALFCYLRPDVRTIFAAPERYNAGRYSSGTKALWHVPLGDTSDLRKRLDSVGTFVID